MTTSTMDSVIAKAIHLGLIDDMTDVYDDTGDDSVFSDDGYLHILIEGRRIAVWIGDDLATKAYHKAVADMLITLGVDTSDMTVMI